MKRLSILLAVLVFPVLSMSQTTIHMEQSRGVYMIPCSVNGLKMKFIFDTGASQVAMSSTELVFMVKNGYLKTSDIGETVNNWGNKERELA